ncbi:hypothetical protein F4775DRAFT_588586 [Biscogniauxia sp. FL1348]|nr:hypothetical protein F4775DRAFT_588586 [Biscogniauxia sp. FL1348]
MAATLLSDRETRPTVSMSPTRSKIRSLSASAVQLDLASDKSIYDAVKKIERERERENGRLDVLAKRGRNGDFSPTSCLPLLERAEAPRIVFVSSRNGSMQHNLDRAFAMVRRVPMSAYKASKAGVNAFAISYMTTLESRGGGGGAWSIGIVCPGFIHTKMAGFDPQGWRPEVAAGKAVEMAALGKGGVPREHLSTLTAPVPC